MAQPGCCSGRLSREEGGMQQSSVINNITSARSTVEHTMSSQDILTNS